MSGMSNIRPAKGVARGGGLGAMRNYDKHLPLRDWFLAGLLISGLTKEKYITTLTTTKVSSALLRTANPGQTHSRL